MNLDYDVIDEQRAMSNEQRAMTNGEWKMENETRNTKDAR
jgi:hypothetical protein